MTRVRRSKIAGMGLFATVDIPAGTTIIPSTSGKVLHWRSRWTKVAMNWAIQVAADEWLLLLHSPLVYANHCCQPNAAVVIGRSSRGPTLALVATRDIAAGDEVAWDYDTTERGPTRGMIAAFGGERWTMPCHCGARRCRKVIGVSKRAPIWA